MARTIDYSDTQLSDEELQCHLQRLQNTEERDRLAKLALRRKIYSFRFVGGMC